MAVAVPVLAVSLVSCSGGGDGGGDGGGGKGKDGQGQQSSGGSGEDSGGGEGSDASLNEKQLKSALLKSGDVKGYRTQRNKEDALPPQNALDSDDPRCSAITDAIDSEPEHARTAYTSGVLLKGALGRGAALQQVLLSAYEEGEAAEWLGELKKALKVCDSFTGKVGPGEKTRLRVSPREGAGVGDDSVQFTMRDAKQQDSPTVFTIVRTGGSTSSFMSVSLTGKPQPVEKALVEKQHEKLKAAAKN
ncbi:hypothetical protein [Streptomyces albidus (ex Kaewkla and Franco 2022)]|uniref:hypothetical protein n=1 Tax=Streptomyces albidus (ex Kaewkla and Franco 2022) TaxID=722709 RepID=UPI0015EF91E1|nr:hypothetical protein [Streptomyces albidus (ex Kaewkla and Franco 2022)]